MDFSRGWKPETCSTIGALLIQFEMSAEQSSVGRLSRSLRPSVAQLATVAASHSDMISVAGRSHQTQMITTSSVFVTSWFSGEIGYGEVIKTFLFHRFSPCYPSSMFFLFSIFLLHFLPLLIVTSLTDVATGLRPGKSRNRGRFSVFRPGLRLIQPPIKNQILLLRGPKRPGREFPYSIHIKPKLKMYGAVLSLSICLHVLVLNYET